MTISSSTSDSKLVRHGSVEQKKSASNRTNTETLTERANGDLGVALYLLEWGEEDLSLMYMYNAMEAWTHNSHIFWSIGPPISKPYHISEKNFSMWPCIYQDLDIAEKTEQKKQFQDFCHCTGIRFHQLTVICRRSNCHRRNILYETLQWTSFIMNYW